MVRLFDPLPSLKTFIHIGGEMVSVFASSAVDRGFESRSGHTKDYEIGIHCFSANHTASMRKRKCWLARYQYNVSEWDDIFTCECCFSELAL